jgi:uncharacterized membrane protein YukC
VSLKTLRLKTYIYYIYIYIKVSLRKMSLSEPKESFPHTPFKEIRATLGKDEPNSLQRCFIYHLCFIDYLRFEFPGWGLGGGKDGAISCTIVLKINYIGFRYMVIAWKQKTPLYGVVL